MQRVYDDNLAHVGEEGGSREEEFKALRRMGSFLIVEVGGYEPRWLKDFP